MNRIRAWWRRHWQSYRNPWYTTYPFWGELETIREAVRRDMWRNLYGDPNFRALLGFSAFVRNPNEAVIVKGSGA